MISEFSAQMTNRNEFRLRCLLQTSTKLISTFHNPSVNQPTELDEGNSFDTRSLLSTRRSITLPLVECIQLAEDRKTRRDFVNMVTNPWAPYNERAQSPRKAKAIPLQALRVPGG